MSAYWFSFPSVHSGHTVEQVIKLLGPRGITLHAPIAKAYYYIDEYGALLKSIGMLTVHAGNRIVAWPHEQLPEPQVRALLGAAEEASLHRPTKERRWERRRRNIDKSYWACDVMVAIPQTEEPIGRLIGRDHHINADRIST
jgi:hypothetical protein